VNAGRALTVLSLSTAAILGGGRGVAAEPVFTGDVAALAVDGERLFIGAFDRGVFEAAPGASVTAFADPAIDLDVNALLVDRAREHLYVATARGVARCALHPRRCERVGGRASEHALIELSNGVVLAGGDNGVLAIAPGAGRVTTEYSRKSGAPFRAVWAFAEAADGTVFVGATNGLHYGSANTFVPGEPAPAKLKLARAGMVTGDLPDDWVTALTLAPGQGETLHVGTYNSGVTSFRVAAGAIARSTQDVALGYVNPAGVTPLSGGRLAVATMDGLRVGASGKWATVATDARDVTAVLAAPGELAGAYWVATRHGVSQAILAANDMQVAERHK
jgi:ligand-binding sensor domain-containing protein